MASADSPIIGSIDIFAGNFAPLNWFLCQGQTLPISQYQALFAIIGTTYGGNGTSNFQLPDLRMKLPLGAQDQNSSGETGGSEQVTLTLNQMPIHTHLASLASSSQFTGNVSLPVKTGLGQGTANPQGAFLGPGANIYFTSPTQGSTLGSAPVTVTAQSGAPVTVQNTGSSLPVPIMPPYVTINYIICWQGVFPTRP